MTPREYLASLEFHGIKLGLDNIRFLCERAGNPHLRHATVHVAGTNGKGSVLAFLDAMLRAAGYTTGRFAKPHLLDVTERFLVDAVPIGSAELDDHIRFFRGIGETMPHSPTYFEVATAVAFRCFASRPLDAVLIEVGMGGRFDSTNVVSPVVTTITNVDLEHTKYLGDTREKIAFEKAGIIKEGVPVVVGETRPGPRDVILARAEALRAPVRLLSEDFNYRVGGTGFDLTIRYESPSLSLGPVPLGLAGRYQVANAALALATADLLRERLPNLTETAMTKGLATVKWPCRLERFRVRPSRDEDRTVPVIIDVAHNPAGAERLRQELPDCVMVLAVAADKDAAGIVRALGPLCRPLILSQFTGSRALAVDALCKAAGDQPHRRVDSLREAVELGLSLASDELPLVIAGGLMAAGEARGILTESYGAPPLEF